MREHRAPVGDEDGAHDELRDLRTAEADEAERRCNHHHALDGKFSMKACIGR